jgi:ribonuclease BN (tRNA processing enzyme)
VPGSSLAGVAYTGDTGWTETLVELAAGADVLIAMAYSFDREIEGCLSYRDLARHRRRLDCLRVVLTHLGPDMLEHLGEVDPTVAEVAEDFMVVEL